MKKKILVKALVVFTSLFMLSAPNVLAQNWCEPDFDYDGDVDGVDLDVFRDDFGRSSANKPCPPCQ